MLGFQFSTLGPKIRSYRGLQVTDVLHLSLGMIIRGILKQLNIINCTEQQTEAWRLVKVNLAHKIYPQVCRKKDIFLYKEGLLKFRKIRLNYESSAGTQAQAFKLNHNRLLSWLGDIWSFQMVHICACQSKIATTDLFSELADTLL